MKMDLTWSAATHTFGWELWLPTAFAIGLAWLLARVVARAPAPYWYLGLVCLAGLACLYAWPLESPDLWEVARSDYWPYAAHVIIRLSVVIFGLVTASAWRYRWGRRPHSNVAPAT